MVDVFGLVSIHSVLQKAYLKGKEFEQNDSVVCIIPNYEGVYNVIDSYGNITIIRNNKHKKLLVPTNKLIPSNIIGLYNIPICLN